MPGGCYGLDRRDGGQCTNPPNSYPCEDDGNVCAGDADMWQMSACANALKTAPRVQQNTNWSGVCRLDVHVIPERAVLNMNAATR